MVSTSSWFGGFRRGAKVTATTVFLLLVASGCGGAGAWSTPPVTAKATYQGASANDLAARIAGGDGSADARKALRGLGRVGLDAALAAYDDATKSGAEASVLERLSAAADTAAQQRDAVYTRLYWYTDLEEAEQVAQREHKPILSLRLLGHLDEELSCANSRFFRTTLYPDHDVNARLQKSFVLHWSSERPVPIVTIDYGEGRVVKRTMTGNSIHYILDPHGRVVDALPGLYSAGEFVKGLDGARIIALSSDATASEAQREQRVTELQTVAIEAARARWTSEASAIGFFGSPIQKAPAVGVASPALLAIPIAAGKALSEMPIAQAIAFEIPTPSDVAEVPWARIGARLRSTVHIDDASRHVMREKAPLDWSTGKPTALDDAGFARLVDKFEEHLAEDTGRNELVIHPQIRRWIAAEPSITLEALNERVYGELFLTPASDPWLGLVPPIVYSGIQGDGLVPKR